MLTADKYEAYVQILKEELLPAMGCTEPIAISYAGAIARKVHGELPEKVCVEVSRNIIKNVKSVVVPNTGGMVGIKAAAAIGIVAGRPDIGLEVISEVTEKDIEKTKEFLKTAEFSIKQASSGRVFDILITLCTGNNKTSVRILDNHTNVVMIKKNNDVILSKEITGNVQRRADRSLLNVDDIYEFANTVDINDVKETLDRQISYNKAISEAGLKGNYGACIGKTLLKVYGDNNVEVRAKAKAAAGSDARMNGCELPVVINSGSGNQGLTVSIPVIEYAKELNVPEDKLYRALVISNLLSVHIKHGIGTLSAYCGAVSAGCSSAAAISYLIEGNIDAIKNTLINGLAIASGIICDGAKSSCAAKIVASLDAGLMGYKMYKEGHRFAGGDGIVKDDVEGTINSVGRLASLGMAETDKEIVKIMIEDE